MSSSSIGCYYKILGVKKDATIDEIKSSFRQLCLKYHPDVVSSTTTTNNNNKNNAERFKQITVAAGVLTNPKKRMKYDASIRYGSPYDDVDDDHVRNKRTDSSSPYAYSSSSSSAFNDYAWARRTERRKQQQQQQQQRRTNTRNFYSYGGGFHQRLRIMFHPVNLFFVGPLLFYTAVTTIRFVANKVDAVTATSTSENTNTDDSNNTILFTTNKFGASSDKLGNNDVVQAWKNPMTNQYETPAPWDPIYRQLKPELVLVPRGFVKARPR